MAIDKTVAFTKIAKPDWLPKMTGKNCYIRRVKLDKLIKREAKQYLNAIQMMKYVKEIEWKLQHWLEQTPLTPQTLIDQAWLC
jgi:formiminotetrahydrofolate cyclodeaminase